MAYLTLSDGTVFEGDSFGYEGDAFGEVVFNTGMTGYQELLTDPSYAGQIVNMTYPLIGNYGINTLDAESDTAQVRGLIVRDYCGAPSNWKCEKTLEEYLKENKVVALQGIDTRALTRKLRNGGSMTGIISQDKPTLEQISALKGNISVSRIAAKEPYDIEGSGEYRVAVIDYGLKRNTLENLKAAGFKLRVFPASTAAEEILKYEPDGIVLTSGPGDPKDNKKEIDELKKLKDKLPIFGIGLGHQLLALSFGGDTTKMKYGHRGANHPVKELKTGRVFITAQSHGYTVDGKSIEKAGKVTFVNRNDGSVEGIEYYGSLAFSVQFHPRANSGVGGTGFLFERFTDLIAGLKEKKDAKR